MLCRTLTQLTQYIGLCQYFGICLVFLSAQLGYSSVERSDGIQLLAVAFFQSYQFFYSLYLMLLRKAVYGVEAFVHEIQTGRVEFHFVFGTSNIVRYIFQLYVVAVYTFSPFGSWCEYSGYAL